MLCIDHGYGGYKADVLTANHVSFFLSFATILLGQLRYQIKLVYDFKQLGFHQNAGCSQACSLIQCVVVIAVRRSHRFYQRSKYLLYIPMVARGRQKKPTTKRQPRQAFN